MPRLHFVQELPVGSSRRDKELERAKARAHAASVSYQSHHHRSRDVGSQTQVQTRFQPQPRLPAENSVTLNSITGSNGDLGPGPFWDDGGGGGGDGDVCGSGHGSSAPSNPPLSFYQSQHGLQTPPQSPPQEVEHNPDSSGVIASLTRPWAADVMTIHPSSNQELTPPDVNCLESGDGEGESENEGEGDTDMGNMDLNHDHSFFSNTGMPSSSSALILPQTTAGRHRIYQINPDAHGESAATMPWTTTSTSMSTSRSRSGSGSTNAFFPISISTATTTTSIPHDLLGTRADPFDCIPRRHAHAASVTAVIDYHAQIMAPNHAPIYKIFDVTNVYTSYYFELLAHPDFLYTGVASVQAVIDHLRRGPGSTSTSTSTSSGPSENVLRHIGTAMVRLRRRLGRGQQEMREQERAKMKKDSSNNSSSSTVNFSPQVQRAINGHELKDPATRAAKEGQANDDNNSNNNDTPLVDDMTIMTVLFLAVVTRAINDLPAHEVHKKTLASLVAARGGLQNLTGHDGLARCTLMQWESFWALNTGHSIFPESRPTYQPLYPPSPMILASSPLLGQKLSVLPLGFQALANHQRLALDVLEVLFRTAEAHVEQMQHGTIVTPSDVFRTKPRRFQDFWEACTCLGAPDEVIHLGFAKDGMVDAEEVTTTMTMPNLEKMIVLALLLYCLHTFSPMRAVTAVYNGSRMKLTTDAPRRTRRKPVVGSILTPGSNSPLECDGDVARESHTRQMNIEMELEKIEKEEDVLVWVWFNLVDSWRAANDTLLPQGLQIMHALRLRFPERTATWEGCEGVLRGFFWNDSFIQRCHAFWVVSERRENG